GRRASGHAAGGAGVAAERAALASGQRPAARSAAAGRRLRGRVGRCPHAGASSGRGPDAEDGDARPPTSAPESDDEAERRGAGRVGSPRRGVNGASCSAPGRRGTIGCAPSTVLLSGEEERPVSDQPSGLMAGAAGATITPDHLTHLQGFGARTEPATGVLDQLEARAIVFQDGRRRVAILAADLLGLDRGSVDRIRAAVTAGCGLLAEDLVVVCSHTHAGPAVMEALAGTDADSRYRAWVETALADVVVAAARAPRAVTLGVGEGTA